MKDAHTHCPCNGVLLCGTCHDWVHAHPFDAKAEGFIVSRHEPEPGEHKVNSHYGPLILVCDGTIDYWKEQP